MSINDDNAANTTPEPTLRDIFNMLKNCASKNDLEEIKKSIVDSNTETQTKVDEITRRVDTIDDTQHQHTEKIKMLEINFEILKQDQLKNNVCVSGVPPAMIKQPNNTMQLVTSIAKSLKVELNVSQFSSYAVANNKFIIIHFYNLKHKQMLLNKIRIKKSLMVEEVFSGTQSNSQIYLNDHLTPYFNNLYIIARNAKKQEKLSSASSYGGKIRVRKTENDVPSVITNESQLRSIIDDDTSDMSFNTTHQTIDDSDASSSVSIATSTTSKKSKEKKSKEKKTTEEKTNATNSVVTGATTSRGNNKRQGNRSNDSNNNNNNNSKNSSNQAHVQKPSRQLPNNKNIKNNKRLLDTSGTAVDTGHVKAART